MSSPTPVVSLSSPMMSSSPLVSKVMDKRRKLHQSRHKWKWALANLAGALLALIEGQRWHFLISGASRWRTLVSGFESVLVVVFLTNAILDTLAHFFPFANPLKALIYGDLDATGGASGTGSQDLVLTKQQMSLLGVEKSDPGFKLYEEKKKAGSQGGDRKHPFGFGPPLEGSFIASSSPTSFHHKTMDTLSSSVSSLNSSSWHYIPNASTAAAAAAANQAVSTPKQPEQYVPRFNSSFQNELAVMKDERSLNQFLREYDDWEKSYGPNNTSMQAEMGDTSLNNTSLGWRTPGGVANTPTGSGQMPSTPRQDFSPYLKKMSYQVSSPMPDSAKSPDNAASGRLATDQKSPTSPRSDAAHASVCARLGVGPLKVVDYLENLRLWISQTVLKRLVDEIDKTNGLLVKHGMSDERIGLIGIEKLKKVALMPHILQQVPSLDALIPFLDFHPNQEYLVQRYRELSQGGAISDFKWNSGGKFPKAGSGGGSGNEWTDKLPTDAEVVMNCVSAYLDTRLPRNFVSNDGKPFTGIYYHKYSSSTENASKSAANASAAAGNSASNSAKEPQSFISKLSPDVRALLALSPRKINAEKEDNSAVKEVKTTEAKDGDGQRGCIIVQSSLKPPCYELHLKDSKSKSGGSGGKPKDGAVGGSSRGSKDGSGSGRGGNGSDIIKISVGAGRNNLFYTLLLFLHHIRSHEHGMLGRIHFGSSGVNLLRVIEAYD